MGAEPRINGSGKESADEVDHRADEVCVRLALCRAELVMGELLQVESGSLGRREIAPKEALPGPQCHLHIAARRSQRPPALCQIVAQETVTLLPARKLGDST